MDDLRDTIRKRIRSALLPGELTSRLYAGPGEGRTCSCCDQAILQSTAFSFGIIACKTPRQKHLKLVSIERPKGLRAKMGADSFRVPHFMSALQVLAVWP
jgi:hypothetical protein